jgi:hypothetical protein
LLSTAYPPKSNFPGEVGVEFELAKQNT